MSNNFTSAFNFSSLKRFSYGTIKFSRSADKERIRPNKRNVDEEDPMLISVVSYYSEYLIDASCKSQENFTVVVRTKSGTNSDTGVVKY